MSRITVANYIASSLSQLGIDHVFGVPGGAIDPLYTALDQANIKSIVARSRIDALTTK